MMRVAYLMVAIAGSLLCLPAPGQPKPSQFDGTKWIWSPPPTGKTYRDYPAATLYFRAEFTVPDRTAVKSAEAFITADNLYTLYLNGKTIGENMDDPGAWNQPGRFDIKPHLADGRNVIAVRAVNTAPSPAGLVAKFIVELVQGQPIVLATGDAWRYTGKEEPNWHQPGFADKHWNAVYVIGDYGMPPWGKLPDATAERKPLETVLPQVDSHPPADYVWPEGIVFVGDDCSLKRPLTPVTDKRESLTVTTFNPRHSRGFPEHDLPAPIKVGHKLYSLVPARPDVTPHLLLDAGRGAIGSPAVSYNGKSIYVSMARDDEPFFHIHRLPAGGGDAQRLTDGPFHDIDPAELPDGRIVFTSTRIGTFEEYHNPPSRALFVMNADGSDIHPITHTIIFDNEPRVMADGRIIFIRSDNFFDRGKVETLLHSIRPDGTHGYTEFGLDNSPEYGTRLRAFICGSPAPMPDGRVAFVSGPGITVGRPADPQQNWRNFGIEAGDVAALPDGRLLCTVPTKVPVEIAPGKSKRKVHDLSYQAIGIFNPDAKEQRVTLLHTVPGATLHSPMFLGARPRPPVLNEMVDRAKADDVKSTGILFCQNARLTRNTTAGWPHVRAIRVLAGKGLTTRSSHSYIVHAGNETVELGTVPLAPDGSFAVEVPADTPIAFQAVDAEGRSELNEMSWIYVRPGEQRGCVGCHSSRQEAPSPATPGGMLAMRTRPLALLGQGQPHRFRGNNPAVTGLMELQFDRFREIASLNRHSESPDPLATGAQEVAALIANLQGGDTGLKVSSAQRLAIFRDPAAAPALAKCLADKSREVRVACAIVLAGCGTRESVPFILDALTDPDPLVAQSAAIALENLTGHSREFDAFASSAQRSQQAHAWRQWFAETGWGRIEDELIRRLASPDRDIVRRAAVALGHIGGRHASAALGNYVALDRDNSALLAWRKKHQGDEARFNSLDPMNPRTLQAMTRSVGYLEDAAMAPILADILRQQSDPANGNLFIAEAAAEALGRIATPDAESALITAFAALKDYPQYSSWYGDHGALMACHSSPVHHLIIEALDAMGSTRAAPIVPHLIRSVPTDPDRALFPFNDDYETLVGRVIRRNGAAPAVIETCLAILGDPQATRTKEIEQAVAATHEAWAGRPGPENRAAQILSLTCRDRACEPRIRAAYDRYRATTTDIQRVFDRGIPIVEKLPVKHWVCFYLARELGNLADAKSVESLLAALDQSPPEFATGSPDPLGPGVMFLHNDLTPCWRAASAWALGRIGDHRAVPVLLKTVADLQNAPDTRHAAAESLGLLIDATTAEQVRKLAADYPEVSTRRALLRACEPFAKAKTVSGYR
ncbi:MAG: HEAT repeat domain-containing protein [Tepidisphaerales bacterium]